MTMQDDVRSALERQQSALGDVGDARHRLMHEAMLNRDRPAGFGWQWAAAVAAVLIAAIVITTFALVKAGGRTSTIPVATPSPKAQASPTPLKNILSVPDSTPIVMYSDPSGNGQLDGVAWDGRTSGMLPNAGPGAGNPQNNLFASADSVTNRAGATVMTGSFGLKSFQGMWSDDGRHICLVTPFDNPGGGGLPTMLELVAVGGSIKHVARVGTLYNQTYVRVLACSTVSDRAVVVQSGGQGVGTTQVWVIQLSTGHTIWTHGFDPTQTNVTVVSSRDGMYVAEDLMQAAPAGSTVYGGDGKAIRALSDWVEGFSWNGAFAIVDGGLGLGSARLISTSDASVIWAAPYHWVLVSSKPQPDGNEIAIWVAPTTQLASQSQPPTLFIVDTAGAVLATITGAGPIYP